MSTVIQIPHLPETEKFLRLYEEEKKKGLVSIHFFPGNIRSTTTQEDFFREINLVNELNAQGKTVEIKRDDVL